MAPAASSVSLSAPYAIFPLSQPLHQTRAKDREGGTYRACFTSSVESPKKGKRGATESVVAVDGEGVNIYDVRATQVVSTYALPPTTKFSCAPTSSFARRSSSFSRRTYAAVSMPKKQILCWEEHGVASTDDKAEAINLLSRNGDSRHDVIYLQDLAAGRKRGGEGGLLAVYADGYVRCFSSDLKTQKWEFLAQSLSAAKKVSVVYAATTSLAIAKKAILKNHLDLVLPEATTDEETSEDIILFTVTRNGSTFEARIFSIPTESTTPRELLILPLPTTDEPSTFSLHPPTGTLTLLSPTTLTTVTLTSTLTSTLPTTVSSLHLPNPPTSLLRISSTTVLVATQSDISLYDTNFTSLQSRTPTKTQASITLTSYLPILSLALGYSQHGIIALQLSKPTKKSGLLIDSLSRGLPTATTHRINTAASTDHPIRSAIVNKLSSEQRRLSTALAKLEEARRKSDVDAFEAAVEEYVGSKTYKRREKKIFMHAFVAGVLDSVFGVVEGGFWPGGVMRYLGVSGNLSGALLPTGWVGMVAGWEGGVEKVEWMLGVVSGVGCEELVQAVKVGMETGVKGVMKRALVRLDTFPSLTVVAALKILEGEELMQLIEVLRTELAGEEVLGVGDVGVVAGLLTCAVDTMGVGALVVSGGDVVESLHEEVSDAVEAVEEAAGLKGILEEMFRHVKGWKEAEKKGGREEKRKKERKKKKKIEVRGKAPEQEIPKKDTSTALVPVRSKHKTPRNSARKLRVSRASADARARHVSRLEARRKPRRVSALLPLGLAPVVNVRVGVVEKGLGMGESAERREMERKRGREAGIRESLVKGVYSVESMVV